MYSFVTIAFVIGIIMLVRDCVEVGRNDACNLVNAVFGARVLSRRTAVIIAGIAVILGATFSAPVMETARKSIFDPTVLTIQKAMAIYVSVYFVDTVLLYGFSGFGLPVSTTACLVFELVGAAWFLSGPSNVSWDKVTTVIVSIIMSIIIAGITSFLVMRMFRGVVRDGATERETVMLHGPWITGAMFTWLTWFMVFKGLKNVEFIKTVRAETFEVYGLWLALLCLWAVYTLLTHIAIVFFNRSGYRYVFPTTAVAGMVCLAFAFGQNDLANAASPGLAGWKLWQHGGAPTDLADIATKIPIPKLALFGCGALMAMGMLSSYAQRVTRAAVNTGSQFDHVALYAPQWCIKIAHFLLSMRPRRGALAPPAEVSETGKKLHYDSLRASVITSVSASVIAFASGRGLPVSTTYVAFAAVLGTGLSDRVYARGDADLKIGRAIWVIVCWFIAPVLAVVLTGLLALLIYQLTITGIVAAIVLNFGARFVIKKAADVHEEKYHKHHATETDKTHAAASDAAMDSERSGEEAQGS